MEPQVQPPSTQPEDHSSLGECAICLETCIVGVNEPEQIAAVTRECGHFFHQHCIREFFRNSPALPQGGYACPVCRKPITVSVLRINPDQMRGPPEESLSDQVTRRTHRLRREIVQLKKSESREALLKQVESYESQKNQLGNLTRYYQVFYGVNDWDMKSGGFTVTNHDLLAVATESWDKLLQSAYKESEAVQAQLDQVRQTNDLLQQEIQRIAPLLPPEILSLDDEGGYVPQNLSGGGSGGRPSAHQHHHHKHQQEQQQQQQQRAGTRRQRSPTTNNNQENRDNSYKQNNNNSSAVVDSASIPQRRQRVKRDIAEVLESLGEWLDGEAQRKVRTPIGSVARNQC